MQGQRGRHRDAARVRSVGLRAALSPVLRRSWGGSAHVVAATLVDPASGLLLDGFSDDPTVTDLEFLAAWQADLANAAAQLADDRREILLVHSVEGRHDVVRRAPDPYGGALVVALVVRGARRHAERALDRVRAMPVGSLAAGPELRPADTVPDPAPSTTSGAVAPPAPVTPRPFRAEPQFRPHVRFPSAEEISR